MDKLRADQPRHLAPNIKRPTIFDLEKHSGFSRSTISRAFNPEASVKKATREKILKTAEKIGYSLHPGARMIRSQRSYRWGLLLPHLENLEYAEIVECLDAEARRNGCHLILGLTHYDPKVESAFLRHWAAGEADGVITDIISSQVNEDLYTNLLERRYPFAALYYAPPGIPVIAKDSYDSFRLGIRHLVELGHRRIAYVAFNNGGAKATQAYRAYSTALPEYGIELDESIILFTENNREAGLRAWDTLKQMPNAPTAVMAFNDTLASGIWIGVHADGLSVPEDLSLIGNDDIQDAALMRFASVRYDRKAMARQAIATLEAMRKEPGVLPEVAPLKSDLVLRDSIARPARRSATGGIQPKKR